MAAFMCYSLSPFQFNVGFIVAMLFVRRVFAFKCSRVKHFIWRTTILYARRLIQPQTILFTRLSNRFNENFYSPQLIIININSYYFLSSKQILINGFSVANKTRQPFLKGIIVAFTRRFITMFQKCSCFIYLIESLINFDFKI